MDKATALWTPSEVKAWCVEQGFSEDVVGVFDALGVDGAQLLSISEGDVASEEWGMEPTEQSQLLKSIEALRLQQTSDRPTTEPVTSTAAGAAAAGGSSTAEDRKARKAREKQLKEAHAEPVLRRRRRRSHRVR